MATGVALAVVLAAFVAAHAALVTGIARRGAWGRALVAAVVLPLAPWWGYAAGLRIPVYAWCAALVLYAVGVVLA
jgi:hypothetical protein